MKYVVLTFSTVVMAIWGTNAKADVLFTAECKFQYKSSPQDSGKEFIPGEFAKTISFTSDKAENGSRIAYVLDTSTAAYYKLTPQDVEVSMIKEDFVSSFKFNRITGAINSAHRHGLPNDPDYGYLSLRATYLQVNGHCIKIKPVDPKIQF